MTPAYGIVLNVTSNSDGTVTLSATNTTATSVSYSNLTLASGADSSYIGGNYMLGLTSPPAKPITSQIGSSGVFPANSTVTVATFTPSSSSAHYDGGFVTLNGDPGAYGLAVEGGLGGADGPIPLWGYVLLGALLLMVATRRSSITPRRT